LTKVGLLDMIEGNYIWKKELFMADNKKKKIGVINWVDLTVENAEEIRDFYSRVAGWTVEPVDMGGYNDFNMQSPGDVEPRAGICHSKGGSSTLPPYWLIYISVESMQESVASCLELGGEVISGPLDIKGYGSYCVIRDPAGAYCALFEPED